MVDGRWSMVDGRWPMADGRWSMVDGRWPMVDVQCQSQPVSNWCVRAQLIEHRFRSSMADVQCQPPVSNWCSAHSSSNIDFDRRWPMCSASRNQFRIGAPHTAHRTSISIVDGRCAVPAATSFELVLRTQFIEPSISIVDGRCVVPAATSFELALPHNSSAIGHRPSVIGHRSSVIGHRSSVIGHRMPARQLLGAQRQRGIQSQDA
jgi:hypothetical protein